ncbi:hypothetical protein JCM14720_16620 [Calditerricola yamamurae]|nr:hypothetical protein [Bacillota bacterium]
MRIVFDQAERVLMDACKRMEQGTLDPVTMLEIKVMACDAVRKIANLSLKVCGGHAYSARTPLERYIRDSMAGTVMGPKPEILEGADWQALARCPGHTLIAPSCKR